MFGRDHVLVLRTEDVFSDSETTRKEALRKAVAHLGLDDPTEEVLTEMDGYKENQVGLCKLTHNLKGAWFQPLKLKCHFMVSIVCFQVRLAPLQPGGLRCRAQKHASARRGGRGGDAARDTRQAGRVLCAAEGGAGGYVWG
jgi:hypothetical protein